MGEAYILIETSWHTIPEREREREREIVQRIENKKERNEN
jgi:hypothetical protein